MHPRTVGGVSAVLLSVGLLFSAMSSLRAQAGTGPAAVAAPADAYYTADQAVRGKAQFNRNCAQCHTTAPGPISASDIAAGRGFAMGTARAVINLGGTFLRSKKYDGRVMYPNVYYVFNRLESMPPRGNDTIGTAIRTDITAFLLQVNGFPAGPSELPPDPQAMKAMPLDEAGFTRIFNGQDFSGMQFLLGPNCRPAPGCGKADPAPVYSIRDGVLVCNGKVHGYWYTEQKYLNFTLRFDYRYVPPPGWDGDEAIFSGQSGYHLFVTQHDVWPRAIEIQGRNYDVLSVIAVNSKMKSTDDVEARRRARKPLGAWNSVEIVSKNGEIRSSLNGVLLSVVSEHEFTVPGHIAFESQGTEIHWRNIRLRSE